MINSKAPRQIDILYYSNTYNREDLQSFLKRRREAIFTLASRGSKNVARAIEKENYHILALLHAIPLSKEGKGI